MEICFEDERLKHLIEDQAKFRRRFGVDATKVLLGRLDDLLAARNLEEMRSLPGKCEELIGNRKGLLSLRLSKGLRLIFAPMDVERSKKPDGGLDWSVVTEIVILEVIDYHV